MHALTPDVFFVDHNDQNDDGPLQELLSKQYKGTTHSEVFDTALLDSATPGTPPLPALNRWPAAHRSPCVERVILQRVQASQHMVKK